MLGNYYTLAALAASLANRLAGKQIREIYTQEKSELVIAFDDLLPVLIISCNPRTPTCYLHPAMARARKNSTDVLSAATNTGIDTVSIHPGDRVLAFHLRNDFSLIAQLYGTQSNVLLVDNAGEIRDAFKRGHALIGGRYEVRTPHLIHDIPLLRTMLGQEPAATVSAILKRVFPAFGTPLADELVARTALAPGTASGALDPPGIDQLCSQALALLTELSAPKPRVYLSPEGTPAMFSIVKLCSMANLTEKPFVDIHEAIRFFLSRRRASAGLDNRKAEVISAINRLLDKDRRTADALEEEQRASSRAGEYERNGKLLLAHLGSFQKGDRSVTIDDASGTFLIPLDAKLTPVQNAQRCFNKSKRSREASLIGTERLSGIRNRIARGNRLIEGISSASDPESVTTFMNEHNHELEEFGLGVKGKAEEHLPFRLFTVDGGFEVWAGKSSANNDLLTLRHTKPNDLWFHARGSGGSHVVLKVGTGKGDPGKKAREQAAAIAAYYSKMKNAKIVPVAMTEKKYVRKPKGAPPGTVVLEREKVIFVEPALPAKEPE